MSEATSADSLTSARTAAGSGSARGSLSSPKTARSCAATESPDPTKSHSCRANSAALEKRYAADAAATASSHCSVPQHFTLPACNDIDSPFLDWGSL